MVVLPMRIHCPACSVEYQVPEKMVIGASRARCGQCLAVFALDAAFRSHDASPPEESAGVPRSEAGPAEHTFRPAKPSFSNVAPRLARRDGGPGSVAGRPGPPPPYRPAEPGRRPTPSRDEMASALRVSPNISGSNRPGPASAYRPMLRTDQDLARRSAPDPEPLRPSSLSRPSGEIGREADWSLARDPRLDCLADPRPQLTDRTEPSRYLARRDIPASWAAGNPIPPFVSSRRTSVARKLRPVLWAAGIAATTAILGGVLGSERGWIYPAHGSPNVTASEPSYRVRAATVGGLGCAAAEKSDLSPGHGIACGDGKSEAAAN